MKMIKTIADSVVPRAENAVEITDSVSDHFIMRVGFSMHSVERKRWKNVVNICCGKIVEIMSINQVIIESLDVTKLGRIEGFGGKERSTESLPAARLTLMF
jgi:hypothetical protein